MQGNTKLCLIAAVNAVQCILYLFTGTPSEKTCSYGDIDVEDDAIDVDDDNNVDNVDNDDNDDNVDNVDQLTAHGLFRITQSSSA